MIRTKEQLSLASHADATKTARTVLASCSDITETASKAREPKLTSQIDSNIPKNDILSQIQLDNVQAESRNESVKEGIEVARTMLRRLEEGKFTVEEVCSTEVVQRISEKLKHVQTLIKNQRTAVLWTAYMEMVEILRRFIKAVCTVIGVCTSNRFMTCFLILPLLVTDFMLNRLICTYK